MSSVAIRNPQINPEKIYSGKVINLTHPPIFFVVVFHGVYFTFLYYAFFRRETSYLNYTFLFAFFQ